jgi:hypothetical protein
VSARTLAVAVVVSLAVLSVTAPLAAAAGGTTMSIVATNDSISPGETTTVDVVVNDVDGGAGAAEFRVSVADATVAKLTDVTVLGSGRVVETVADDGSWIDVKYAFADTADAGSVVVAEVTVEGVGDGSTDITLEPAAGNDATVVYDEAGTGYRVTGTDGVRLSVGSGGGVDADADESVGPNENAPPSADDAADETQNVPNDDSTDGADESDATGGAGGSNTAGDADSSDSESSADAADVSSDSAGTASSGAKEQASEQSNDAGSATTFGTALNTDGIERALGGVSGPVGLVAAVTIGFLLGIGFHRRR